MYKGLKIVQIAIWAVIALALVGILLAAVTNGSRWFGNWSFNMSTGEQKLVKEETAQLDGIQQIVFDCTNADLNVSVTDDKKMSLKQYAPEKYQKEMLFSVSKNGKELKVTQNYKNFFNFGFFFGNSYTRIDITLPQEYADVLTLKSVSGDVSVSGNLKLTNLKVQQTSGSFDTNGSISTEQFTCSSVSGDVKLLALQCKEYDISSTSGSINAETIEGSGSARSLSGNVKFSTVTGEKFDYSSTSGEVEVGTLVGYGYAHSVSGDVRIESCDLQGDIELSSTSGSVSVRIPENTSIDADLNTTSGDIDTDFKLDYSHNEKHCSGTSGDGPYFKVKMGTVSGDIRLDTMK